MYSVKGYDEININRLNAMAADYFNKFAVDSIVHRFPSTVMPPLQYTNIDIYDLNDKEFIESVDNAILSIIAKRSLH
jgi:hypothetical protein